MKNKSIKTLGLVVLVSAVTAIVCLFAFKHYFSPTQDIYVADAPAQVRYASYNNAMVTAGPNSFTRAAQEVVPATVHINTKVLPREVDNPFSGWFSGERYSPGKLASGSGVIVSQDGYIVTNNHVIEGASDIVVTLNDQSTYKAQVVGADPNTDLAVLKIDATGLPAITFGNSDTVEIGQWVLACGYPLNLQSTVTAGIISAKSRNIGINHEGLNPIETYIQTDAAVNPGNSGGPLVDTEGRLVGINSAIATPTGSFAGYAYAVPSNLVRKVVNDILKYGKVQRAFLGIYLPKENKMHTLKAAFNNTGQKIEPGVPVAGVREDGAAAAAGIQEGDRIIEVDHAKVVSQTDLLGLLARHHPGDKITVTYLRNGAQHTTDVVLKNKNGTTDIIKHSILDVLGAQFVNIDKEQAEKLGIPGGVLVGDIGSGLINSQTDMHKYFVIVQVGNYPVRSVEDLKEAFERQGNNVMIKGFYPGRTGMMYYAINDVKSGIVN